MTNDRTSSGSGAPPDATDPESVGKWLSLLLGALVGAFAFLGIEGDEVSAILRNQRWEASVIALLVAAALGMSVVSFFVGGLRMPLLAAVAVILATLSINPAMIFAIAIGPKSSNWSHAASLIAAVALFVLAVVASGVSLVRRTPDCLAQPVVLLVGVLLLATAVYSGLRLETRSQYRTTSPQVSASYETTEMGTKVILDVDAERLRSADDVSLRAVQLPRRPGVDIDQQCGAVAAADPEQLIDADDPLATCRERPCTVLPCTFVAGAQLRPNALGEIDDTFEFPLDRAAAEHLTIEATLCLRDDQDEDDDRRYEALARLARATAAARADVVDGGGCSGRTRLTVLDVRVPMPDELPAEATSGAGR